MVSGAVAASAAVQAPVAAAGTPTQNCENLVSGGPAVCDWYASALIQAFSCTSTTYAYPNNPIGSIDNSCPYRVWLHQYENNTGLTYCIDPNNGVNQQLSGWETHPGNLQVTSNRNNC